MVSDIHCGQPANLGQSRQSFGCFQGDSTARHLVEYAAVKALLYEIYDLEQSQFPTVCITDSKSLKDIGGTLTIPLRQGFLELT